MKSFPACSAGEERRELAYSRVTSALKILSLLSPRSKNHPASSFSAIFAYLAREIPNFFSTSSRLKVRNTNRWSSNSSTGTPSSNPKELRLSIFWYMGSPKKNKALKNANFTGRKFWNPATLRKISQAIHGHVVTNVARMTHPACAASLYILGKVSDYGGSRSFDDRANVHGSVRRHFQNFVYAD